MATLDDIKHALRDFVIDGDPRSGVHNPSKADFLAFALGILQAQGNPQALDALKAEINTTITSRDFRATRFFTSRAEAASSIEAGIPVPVHIVFGLEAGVLIVRHRASADDPLFPEAGAQGKWGVSFRVDLEALRDRSNHTGTQGMATIAGLAAALNDKASADAGIKYVERTKLEGIATGATKNDTDVNLRDRSKHTGKQSIATIDQLAEALAGKAPASRGVTDAERTKLTGIEAGAQKNSVTGVAGKTGNVTLVKADVGLSSVDNTADADKPVSTKQQLALDGKQAKGDYAPASAGVTTGERTKLTGIEAGAQKNTVTGVAGKTGNVTLTKADVGLSAVDNTSDADKPVSKAQKAALDAKASVIDLDRTGLVQIDRPGEDRSRWSTVTTGAPEERPPLTIGAAVNSDAGAVLRIRGPDVPASTGYVDVAPRRAYAVDPGRVYRVRATFARAKDSADPSGDTVEVRVQNLNANKAHVSNVLRSQHTPTVAGGLVGVSFTLSRTAGEGVDYVLPATARYTVPFLRIFGVGQETDVVAILWEDVTDALAGQADVSGLRADLTGLGAVVTENKTETDQAIYAEGQAWRKAIYDEHQAWGLAIYDENQAWRKAVYDEGEAWRAATYDETQTRKAEVLRLDQKDAATTAAFAPVQDRTARTALLPPMYFGDREIVVTEVTFDRKPLRGLWADTGVTWLPDGSLDAEGKLPPLHIPGVGMVAVSQVTLDCKPLRGVVIATGRQWVYGEEEATAAAYSPLQDRTSRIALVPPMYFGDREIVVREVTFDRKPLTGVWSDTGLPWGPDGSSNAEGKLPPLNIPGVGMVAVSQMTFDWKPLRGVVIATGKLWAYDDGGDAGGADIHPALQVEVVSASLLHLYVHQTGANYVRWALRHDVNAAKNADGWRLGICAHFTRADGAYTYIKDITFDGETDVAILLNKSVGGSAKPDHIGGAFHGNEELTEATLLIDGAKFDPATAPLGLRTATSVTLLQASNMFEPGDGNSTIWVPKGPLIMRHYKRLDLDASGWFRQSFHVEHVVGGFQVENAYFGMLCLNGPSRGAVVDTAARSPKWLREDVTVSGFARIYSAADDLSIWGPVYGGETRMVRGWIDPGRNVTVDPRSDRRKVYPNFFKGQITDTGVPWDGEVHYRITIKEA